MFLKNLLPPSSEYKSKRSGENGGSQACVPSRTLAIKKSKLKGENKPNINKK
jgi:hypothetical protein